MNNNNSVVISTKFNALLFVIDKRPSPDMLLHQQDKQAFKCMFIIIIYLSSASSAAEELSCLIEDTHDLIKSINNESVNLIMYVRKPYTFDMHLIDYDNADAAAADHHERLYSFCSIISNFIDSFRSCKRNEEQHNNIHKFSLRIASIDKMMHFMFKVSSDEYSLNKNGISIRTYYHNETTVLSVSAAAAAVADDNIKNYNYSTIQPSQPLQQYYTMMILMEYIPLVDLNK